VEILFLTEIWPFHLPHLLIFPLESPHFFFNTGGFPAGKATQPAPPATPEGAPRRTSARVKGHQHPAATNSSILEHLPHFFLNTGGFPADKPTQPAPPATTEGAARRMSARGKRHQPHERKIQATPASSRRQLQQPTAPSSLFIEHRWISNRQTNIACATSNNRRSSSPRERKSQAPSYVSHVVICVAS
jgi:hypothetical protein